MRSVSRINDPIPPLISANISNRPSTFLPCLRPSPRSRRHTSTNWSRRIANRWHPLTPPPCSYDMQTHSEKGSNGDTIIALLPPGRQWGALGAASVLGPVAAVCFFRGSFACRNSTRPAPSNQAAGDPSAGRDQQQHRTPWTNRVLTLARLAATRLQGGVAQWAPSEPRTPTDIFWEASPESW